MRKNGFTLIELIIVVIIIAILAALAAPMMQGMKVRAICAEAVVALGTIRSVLMAYYAEYQSFPETFNFANWLDHPPSVISLTDAGLPPNNLTGTYFSKNCYLISISGDGSDSFMYATPHPEFFGNGENLLAPRHEETDTIDETPPGIIGMMYKTGRITHAGIPKSGY